MTEATIHCPSCRVEIKLNESLAAPLVKATREEYERRIAQAATVMAEREAELRTQRAELQAARDAIETEVADRLTAERSAIAADEARKAKAAIGHDLEERDRRLADLQQTLSLRDAKLAAAQLQQAEFLKKERALDDDRRELGLTVERQVQAELAAVREKAKTEAEDSLKLKVAEKEEQIASMQRQIEELRRRAEQGSQQLQGEVLELQLESMLASRFPTDLLEPVAKGEFGGDVLQRVVSRDGQLCGSILWESKRTKNWSANWLSKLRNDQRAAKAEIALMVSETLPAGTEQFDLIDGVYVAHPRCAMAIAMILRESLISVARSRAIQDGQASKMEQVYAYLTGPRFKHRVEAIVEKFADMQDDLSREKKATIRAWAKREGQIQTVVEATAGMYGDLQGIAGRAMQELASLEMPLLEGANDADSAAAA